MTPQGSSRFFDCLSVGIVVVDAICEPVARLPAAGQLEMTSRISLAIGGCASNVAVDLAKLNRRAAVVGCVGDDPFGQFIQRDLSAAGVDTRSLKSSADTPTSSTLVINVRGEDRRFIHTFGANALFDGSEVTPELLAAARVLYVGGFCLMHRLTGEKLSHLFRQARQAKIVTVLDVVVPDPHGWDGELRQVLPWTDVFLPNTDEARLLTGLADPAAQAERFREWGAATTVITCGAVGALLLGPNDRLRAGVFPVDFVDGTGSGDAFVAGYIDGSLRGLSPAECLKIGSALGASCVRQSGATTGVFTRSELDAFLAEHRLAIGTF